MFDKITLYPARTEYVPYEKKVTISRAPTDESIRLWEEMRDKAYKSILDSIVIEDNSLNMVAQVYRDVLTNNVKAAYKIILNGKEFTGIVSIKAWDGPERMELINRIYTELAHKIAGDLIDALPRGSQL